MAPTRCEGNCKHGVDHATSRTSCSTERTPGGQWRHAAERAAHAETDLSEWRKQYTMILDSRNLGTMRGFPRFAFTGTEKLRVS